MESVDDPGVCASLPSSNSAARLVAGDPVAVLLVARDMLMRGVLVGAGTMLGGAPIKDAVRYGLWGSAMIEAFVLGWIGAKKAINWAENRRSSQQLSATTTYGASTSGASVTLQLPTPPSVQVSFNPAQGLHGFLRAA